MNYDSNDNEKDASTKELMISSIMTKMRVKITLIVMLCEEGVVYI